MKKIFFTRFFSTVLTLLALPSFGFATPLYWYPGAAPNQGGDGSWDTTAANWSTTSGGTKTNASAIPTIDDNIVFGGTAGVVKLSNTRKAADVRFDTNGYVLQSLASSTNTITLTVKSFSGAGLSSATLTTDGSTGTRFINLEIPEGETAKFTGTIANSNVVGASIPYFYKSGKGLLDLSSASLTYTGLTRIWEGTLRLSSAQVSSLSGNILMSGATGNRSILEIDSGGSVGTLTKPIGTGAGQINLGGNGGTFHIGFSAVNGDLKINFSNATEINGTGNGYNFASLQLGADTSTNTVILEDGLYFGNKANFVITAENGLANPANIGGEISGALRGNNRDQVLTKNGKGTLRLSGNSNEFAGRLNVTDGTVLVDGSITSATDNSEYGIQVGASATLGGEGAITFADANTQVLVEGKLMAGRGNADQSFTINSNLTMGEDSVLVFGLGVNGAADELVRNGGTWTFDLNQKIQFIDNGFEAGKNYLLISGLTESNSNVLDVAWSIVGDNSSNFVSEGIYFKNGNLYYGVIPEPSVMILVGLSLTYFLLIRRHRFV